MPALHAIRALVKRTVHAMHAYVYPQSRWYVSHVLNLRRLTKVCLFLHYYYRTCTLYYTILLFTR